MCKQSEEKRINFEARMQTQWDIFVKKMLLTQGQSNDQAESAIDETDDYDDLDENFPIKVPSNIENLEWNIQKDLQFKLRLVNNNSILMYLSRGKLH